MAVCNKRGINTVSTEFKQDSPDDEDILCINLMQPDDTHNNDKWITNLEILSKKVPFRIDTGAKCNTLTLDNYQSLGHTGELQCSSVVLRSYSNHRLKPVAAVNLQISSPKAKVNAVFEILDIAQENVLSGTIAEALGLIARLDLLGSAGAGGSTECVPAGLDDFPELSRTTGTLPGKYTIKLEPNARGVVHPVRRQPAALREKIIEKLHEMEKDGYITKVEQPTEWVSSMVAAVRNGKVRICIDPSDLNKVIKREHHPMRTVEEVVSMIPGAKVFSVLDAKSGFLQIELDEPSSFLTTFNTPIGRFRWLRLPFGIKYAPEIFQRIMDQMLEGVPGAISVMDDILIAAPTIQQHDAILCTVVERAARYNLKLNFNKCHIRQSSVPYVGHMITADGLRPDPAKVDAVRRMPPPSDKEGVHRF